MKYFRNIAIALVLAAVLTPASAAPFKGKVINADTGEPIVGAFISYNNKVKAMTDIDGVFKIDVDEQEGDITVNYLGYESQQVHVAGNDKDYVIQLKEENRMLDEVVKVGYGTQKRTHLTGSVSKVSSEVFENFHTSTIDQALGGAVAGLNITTSGQPGATSQIRIRGGNSVNASNNPLYVIDGFIYYRDASSMQTGLGAIESSLDPLSFINPSDIESIEVLKDDGATAIYGSRGANGVIIITTKKGQRGKNQVHYNGNLNLSSPSKQLHLLNAREWAQMQNDFLGNNYYSNDEIARLGKGTDWQDAVMRSTVSHVHELSFSGGDDKTRYLVSGNFTDQKGIVIGSDFIRYNLRANVERKLNGKFYLSVASTVGKTKQNSLSTTEPVNYKSSPYSAGITNSLTYALFMPPVVPIYNADGSYNYTNPYENSFFSLGDVSVNPVSDLRNTTAESNNFYALLNAYLRYQITDDLEAKLSIGADLDHLTQNFFAPSYTALGLNEIGQGSIGHRQNEATQAEILLTYDKQLNDKHYINALAGYTFQQTHTEYNTTTTSHFTNETLGHHNLGDGSLVYPPKSGYSESALHSFIVRANYTLLERYNATATLRVDHSSRFSKKYRWGWFPSLGLSWNINHEPFFPETAIVSNLKVRASVGVTGNQEIGDYEYATTYSAVSYGGSTAYTKSNLGNDNLKWETTTQVNVGFDLGLWKNRLNLVVDLYDKRTSDLLMIIPVNSSTGANNQLKNVGIVSNRGLEIAINGTPIQRNHLRWNVGANISFNRNELTKMGNGLTQLTSGENTQYILKEGECVGSFYGLIFEGVNPLTGEAKFRDVSGPNGVPDDKVNSYDRVVLGSYQPKFFYGISSTLKWKQWDFSFSFKGSQGGKAYNSLRRSLEMVSSGYNTLHHMLYSWTANNTGSNMPRVTGSYQISYIDSRYVEDASYLKLQHMTAGYTFSLPRVAESVRVYVQGGNLFTITKYKGYDPELNNGRDLGAYPRARTFTFGLEVTF